MLKIICLEGIDGCGKSTQVEMLKKQLEAGYCWLRWKPFILKPLYLIKNMKTNAKNNMNITQQYESNKSIKKKIFKNNFIRFIWFNLSLFDYSLATKYKIKKSKEKHELLIFDRYFYDFVIDQGINFGWDIEQYIETIKKLTKKFMVPEKTILLNISPEDAIKRKNDIPCIDYLKRRYEIYNELAKSLNWKIINATLPKEEINRQIIDVMECS